MRRFLWIVPALVALVPFARLVLHPSALIVDPIRPSVDRALPPDSRAVGNDLTRLFLPHHARIAKTGHISGWDPAGFGGRPLVGNPQAGLWYPPVWVAWTLWTPSALGWLTVAQLCFGSIGAYTLCRSLRIRPYAALIAGCLWATSPYVLGQAYEGHCPHVWSASYSPWAIWAAMGWRRGRPRGWMLPPILALSILTGHAQETYYLGLMLGIWLISTFLVPTVLRGNAVPDAPRRLGTVPRRRGASGTAFPRGAWERVGVLSQLGMMLALTLGLVAIEIVPDLAVRPFTLRRLPPTSADAAKYHVHLMNLVQLVSPLALGGPSNYRGPGSYWESLLSIGFIPLCLAIYAIARSKRRCLIQGWLGLAIVTILFAFGRGFGVFDLLFAIVPGMGLFRVPSRALFLTTLAASVLVGLGVDAIWRWRKWLAVALGILAIAETSIYGLALIRVSNPARFLGPDPVGRAILDHRPPGPFRLRARDAFYGDARAFALGSRKNQPQ